MDNTMAIGLGALGVAIGLGFGYLLTRLGLARRRERQGHSAEDMVTTARLDAQRILATAEEEGRAKAETYREREEADLAHRKLEAANLETRLAQREETLEQRASNLAQREKMLIDREDEVNQSRGDLELLKEEVDKLCAPPNTYGVYERSNKDGTVEINVDGKIRTVTSDGRGRVEIALSSLGNSRVRVRVR